MMLTLSKRVILRSVRRQLTDAARWGGKATRAPAEEKKGGGAAHNYRGARPSKRPAHAKNLHNLELE